MAHSKITLVPCQITATVSVYRGDVWLGRVYCPTTDHTDFIAAAWNSDPVEGFATKDSAISWLTDYIIQPGHKLLPEG